MFILEATCFPVRYLRLQNQYGDGYRKHSHPALLSSMPLVTNLVLDVMLTSFSFIIETTIRQNYAIFDIRKVTMVH